jgi:methylmalonyl-CoA/ethylmalonyl-CoA epimerase
VWVLNRLTIALHPCYFRGSKFAKNRPEKLLDLPLDHIAVAVPSITDALPLYELIAGAKSSPIERVESQGVDVAMVGSGDTRIELLQPVSGNSTVQRFLDRHGPGLHHIAYRVADLDGTLERLAAAGIRLIDQKGRPGAGGHNVAFLHPRSTGGILIELVQG